MYDTFNALLEAAEHDIFLFNDKCNEKHENKDMP